MSHLTLLGGDCRQTLTTLPDCSVQCCVTSPPYFGLRNYKMDAQLGQEPTPDEFVQAMVGVFREVRRVLKPDGVCWINIGDSYAANRAYQVPSTKGGVKHGPAQGNGGGGAKVPDGLKPKDLIGIPWMLAFALRADGWWLRQEVIWAKPNPMPESVTDRCTKSHESIFLLTKSERYHFDHVAIREDAVTNRVPGNVNPSKGQAAYEDGAGEHRTKAGLLNYAKRVSAAKGSFNGKTEAMARTGQNAFRAVTEFRNKRDVWTVASSPFKGAHFATFPPNLIRPCVLAGSRPGDTVLDPFGGSGTTAQVALEEGRDALLIELNPDYHTMIRQRVAGLESPDALR